MGWICAVDLIIRANGEQLVVRHSKELKLMSDFNGMHTN